MKAETEPKQFWEDKILEWEKSRYSKTVKDQSFLEQLAGRASDSLRYRLHLGVQLLVPYVKGRRVIELGCGSGLIAEALLDSGAKSYLGVDISEKAIDVAKQRLVDAGLGQKADFLAADVLALPAIEGDIVLSLGLLDWLTLSEVSTVLKQTSGMEYAHSFSEKRMSIGQLIHRAYVNISYGHRTGSYVPRYYTANEMIEAVKQYSPAKVQVVRDPKLSFGAFIVSFREKQTRRENADLVLSSQRHA